MVPPRGPMFESLLSPLGDSSLPSPRRVLLPAPCPSLRIHFLKPKTPYTACRSLHNSTSIPGFLPCRREQ